MARDQNIVINNLSFGEAPRWRADGLYFSDVHADRVMVLRGDGRLETAMSASGPVSGLGWLPDGRMLVVSMLDKRVLRLEPDGATTVHADLSELATGPANDMIVGPTGVAYVGNFGFSLFPPEPPKLAVLAAVAPDGHVTVAAEDLFFPNGMVITPDGRTLIVGESGGQCLTAFDIADNGGLSNRTEWAALGDGALPDGICLDAEGAIWVASPPTNEVLRIRQGGEVLERIATDQQAIACVLGGVDRKTLYVFTAESTEPAFCREHHTARLLAINVDVPGAGWP
ncbi:SMP-30/gluconolactonase/LRE family protein [Nitrospirillum sp. BR 11163]|uniref:SMP-30/gluconolactonase/LRE family protein n=1 Tax=Nitrospirillum sp. BR 11163 TaxID=3104323 RepID=UPI002AFE78FB|nr:SMP-30/gluconolactonase/LRE family protein [Nitrospirillum sp. BR 11163]MEA1671897.1 SMP-30/gluconolactonase/LRE family protein [Nitrospirillum sp. BR 11163]